MSPNAQARARRRDLTMLLAALVLVLLGAAGWWLWNAQAREARAEVLARVPPFPSQQSGPQGHRRVAVSLDASVAAPSGPRPVNDKLAAFATAPSENLAVVQVNALVNTPLFAKLKACLPAEFSALRDAGELGFDFEKDVDRVAMVPGGIAVSGHFDEHLAARLAKGPSPIHSSYRDADIYSPTDQGCVAQLGSLLLMGEAGGCERLVDRALDTQPNAQTSEALESDLYARTNLQALRDGLAKDTTNQSVTPILDGLGGLTLRANVWDDVALSLDGTARPNQGTGQLESLAAMARLSVEAGKLELAEDPAWSALLDQAKVDVRGGHLQIDLALPANELFEHFNLPCVGRDAGL